MTRWEIPQAAFTAQAVTNTTVDSSVFDHLRVVNDHAMAVTVTAFSGDSVVNVILQGSLDGSDWYELTGNDYSGTRTELLTALNPARYTRVIAGTNDVATTATVTVTVVSGESA